MKTTMIPLILCLFLPLVSWAWLEPHDNLASYEARREKMKPEADWLAIIGDSGVTGAASSPDIEPRWWNLVGQVFDFLMESRRTDEPALYHQFPRPDYFGITDPVEPLTRVFYSMPEFLLAKKEGRHLDLNMEAKASMKLDVEEYTFGYMVGRYLGIKPSHIVLAGKDGVRVNDIGRQFFNLKEVAETLPPRVLVSFTANDMCHRDVLKTSPEDQKRKYLRTLRKELDQVVAENEPHPHGTEVIVLAPIDVMNVLTNQSLLKQEVNFQGVGTMTCKDVRNGSGLVGSLGLEMRKTLQSECGAILETSLDDEQRINHLRSIQEGFHQAWAEVIAEMQRRSPRKLRWTYIEQIRNIEFSAGDLANDCFHPSVRGHTKIAETVIESLFSARRGR